MTGRLINYTRDSDVSSKLPVSHEIAHDEIDTRSGPFTYDAKKDRCCLILFYDDDVKLIRFTLLYLTTLRSYTQVLCYAELPFILQLNKMRRIFCTRHFTAPYVNTPLCDLIRTIHGVVAILLF